MQTNPMNPLLYAVFVAFCLIVLILTKFKLFIYILHQLLGNKTNVKCVKLDKANLSFVISKLFIGYINMCIQICFSGSH